MYRFPTASHTKAPSPLTRKLGAAPCTKLIGLLLKVCAPPGINPAALSRKACDFSAEFDFKYRVLIRQQAPHVGEIKIMEDFINLNAGQARKLTVLVEQEEGFNGYITILSVTRSQCQWVSAESTLICWS